MADIARNLGEAKSHHVAGRVLEAEALYRQILAADPANPEVLYLLGAACHALGKVHDAIDFLQQSLRINPRHPDPLHHLGFVLLEQGQLDEAVSLLQESLQLRPDSAEIAAHLQHALAARHNHLGMALAAQGKWSEAIVHYQQALSAQPAFAPALGNLGNACKHLGRFDEAAACYRRVLALAPGSAQAWNDLGLIAEQQGDLATAVTDYRRAIELQGDLAAAHTNFGRALALLGNDAEAEVCCRRATALAPDYAEAHRDLAGALAHQNKFVEAAACCRRAIELAPDYAEAHALLALVMLLQGRLAEGWREYEWRLKAGGVAISTAAPRWDGSPLAGRTIVLRAEQGHGDAMQFVRYAPWIKELGGTVLVECRLALARLLATCAGVERTIEFGAALPPFDVELPILSLPGVFRTTLETIPAQVPYLSADLAAVARWQDELSGERALKIGIAWQGSPEYPRDRWRSIPLAHFAPLAEVPNVRVYSLQFGAGREQLTASSERWPITDLGDRLGDFYDTAALLKNLDLVISSDSALVHLAGALGVNVWVALPFFPDWRWMLERTDSPWYPTMRLFRQDAPGDWPGVFQQIQTALAEYARR